MHFDVFNGDADGLLSRAKITGPDGQLTPNFRYLEGYVNGQ